jgi:cobalt/nickel transport protein
VKTGTLILLVLGISLLLGGWISNYASSNPDGLEWVAGQMGFLDKSEGEPVYSAAPLPDYAVPGLVPAEDKPNMPDLTWFSTIIAGAGGTLLAFGLGSVLGQLLHKRKAVS